jgi:hypothetical protein
MNEIYKAMQALRCVWHQVNNYRVLCLWKYAYGITNRVALPSEALNSLAALNGRPNTTSQMGKVGVPFSGHLPVS